MSQTIVHLKKKLFLNNVLYHIYRYSSVAVRHIRLHVFNLTMCGVSDNSDSILLVYISGFPGFQCREIRNPGVNPELLRYRQPVMCVKGNTDLVKVRYN